MLIKEIEPISNPTTNLINSDDDLIDQIVELPLRKACKILKQKGIETIMSSSNKNNLLKSGERPKEKEDLYGTFEKLLENHTFLDAGIGYAWLMINFETLSDENKDMLFELEKKLKDGEKLIWFVYPVELKDNPEHALRIGRYDYDFLRQIMSEDELPKNIEVDEKLVEFDKRHIVLLYPWIDSGREAVFIRMPLLDTTTSEEVEEYFSNFAAYFKDQKENKKVK